MSIQTGYHPKPGTTEIPTKQRIRIGTRDIYYGGHIVCLIFISFRHVVYLTRLPGSMVRLVLSFISFPPFSFSFFFYFFTFFTFFFMCFISPLFYYSQHGWFDLTRPSLFIYLCFHRLMTLVYDDYTGLILLHSCYFVFFWWSVRWMSTRAEEELRGRGSQLPTTCLPTTCLLLSYYHSHTRRIASTKHILPRRWRLDRTLHLYCTLYTPFC